MPLCSSCGGNPFTPRVAADFTGLHDRLRTEFGPASVQPDEVASVLQNIQQDLEEYKTEISRLEYLIQEKEHLEQYATQFRSLLSPFRKVPNEILRHIFDDCCDMNSFRVVNRDLRLPMHTSRSLRRKPAMVISSVCSRWRRNALSMPVIWSRISLRWDKHSADYEDESVFFPLSNFLTRSQQYPMTVNIDIIGHPVSDTEVDHPLLEKLFGQIEQWKDFSFNCDDYSLEELLECHDIPLASLPVLRTLCMPRCVNEESFVPFIDEAPNLQSLTLRNLDDVPEEFSYYSQLSHLDFIPRPEHIPDLLDRCPNLLSLRITESWSAAILNVL